MAEENNHIEEVANEFAIAGDFVGGEEIHSGHINATYMATFSRQDGKLNRYIFQRINDRLTFGLECRKRVLERQHRHHFAHRDFSAVN